MSVDSSFYQNLFSLFKGNMFLQVLTIFTHVVLVSFNSSSVIGSYAVIFSFITVLGNVSTGRLELALMLENEDIEAYNVYSVSRVISACISILFGLLILVNLHFRWWEILQSYFFVLFVPLAIFFTGSTLIQFQLLNRLKKFSTVGNSKIIFGLGVGISQVLISFWSKSEESLLLGYILGVLCVYFYCRFYVNKFYSEYRELIGMQTFIRIAQKHKEFIGINNFSSLLNLIASQGPVILLEIILGSSISAYFVTMQKTLNAPSSLFSRAFSDVFYRKVTSNIDKKEIKQFFFRNLKFFGLGLIVIWLGFNTIGAFIYEQLFGTEYLASYEMGKITIYFFFMRYVITSLNSILIAKGRLKSDFVFNFLLFLSQIIPLIVGHYYNLELNQMLILMTTFGMLSYGYLGYIIKIIIYEKR